MKRLGMLLMVGTMLSSWSENAPAAMTAYEESLLSDVGCEEPKDCAEMGYTADTADCTGPVLKCPWDLTKAMCKDEAPNLILYGDGTVTKKLLSNKTPIGVVINEEKRLALALTNIKQDGSKGNDWVVFSSISEDTPLENCKSGMLDSCGTDGRANTDILLKQTTGTQYAAQAVNKYEPAGCSAAFCKKGKWFLASFNEIKIGYSKEADNLANTLYMLRKNGAEVIAGEYWTSTETDSYSKVWCINFNSAFSTGELKNDKNYIRPVVKY